MSHCGERALSLISLAFGLIATGALSLAVSTEYWLLTWENVKVPEGSVDNETRAASAALEETDQIDQPNHDIMTIFAHSGLWRCCIVLTELEEGVPPESCFNIGYFSQSSERFEEADTTNTILRAIRKSSPLAVGSLLMLIIALVLGIAGTSKSDFKTIVSAVLYIFSALVLGMGVIVYISAVNDEVAHRKKTDGAGEGGQGDFNYRYGWAFIFMAATFICSMVAAVSNISYYLHRYVTMEDQLLLSPNNGTSAISDYLPVHGSDSTYPTISGKTFHGLMAGIDCGAGNHNLSIVL